MHGVLTSRSAIGRSAVAAAFCVWSMLALQNSSLGDTATQATNSGQAHDGEEIEIDRLDVALLRAAAFNWDPTEAGGPTIDPACPFGSMHPENDVNTLAKDSQISLAKGAFEPRMKKMQQTLEVALQVMKLSPGRYSAPDRLFGCRSPLDDISRVDPMAESDRLQLKRAAPREATVSLDLSREHIALLKGLVTDYTDWREELGDGQLSGTAGIEPKRPYGMATDVVSDVAKILQVSRPDNEQAFHKERRRLLALHEDMRAAMIIAFSQGGLKAGTYKRGSNGAWTLARPLGEAPRKGKEKKGTGELSGSSE